MFKKLKDKLAEEVKSSPQRIQQFAQAAQAAVTSASSSISDITSNDLFSIGDSDSQQSRGSKSQSEETQKEPFQDVALVQAPAPKTQPSDHVEFHPTNFFGDSQRQRRLSNSSFASDVSFKLPTYESQSMYHLQSDMEVSASEAEERGLGSPGASSVSLERVTKEQLYSAYRRTQERYAKYRTQYADLARHYKLLERDNAKARSVLVETQDKALRRISELREQCSLEQSAKAHLERALRMEIEEKNMKIEALTTNINLLHNNIPTESQTNQSNVEQEKPLDQLIDLSSDNVQKIVPDSSTTPDFSALNNKLEKMEQLTNKYKESLKSIKDKNTQLIGEIQKLQNELENQIKFNERLQPLTIQLEEANSQIQQLKDTNEELQNKINTYDFTKTKEMSTLEIDYEKAREEISELQKRIEVYTKREEENAISLAENKLTIHKELESKEREIKSLKDSLDTTKQELQSLNIIVNDYKTKINSLEEELSKLNADMKEISKYRNILVEKEKEIQNLKQKYQKLEQSKLKTDEEYSCLQLQVTQETAEKCALNDRIAYLEEINKHLTEENKRKDLLIASFNETEQEEVSIWKEKYQQLESEIQEERVELVKLQAEIEKMLENHIYVQSENAKLQIIVANLQSENDKLKETLSKWDFIKNSEGGLQQKLGVIRKNIFDVTELLRLSQSNSINILSDFEMKVTNLLKHMKHKNDFNDLVDINDGLNKTIADLTISFEDLKQQKEILLKNKVDLQNENIEFKKVLENPKVVNNVDIERELLELKQQYNVQVEQLNKITLENKSLKSVLEEVELKYIEAQKQLKNIDCKNEIAVQELTKENNSLKGKLEEIVMRNRESNADAQSDSDKRKLVLDKLSEENLTLKSKLKEIELSYANTERKIQEINEVNKNVSQKLSSENRNLKTMLEEFRGKYNEAESKIREIDDQNKKALSELDKLKEEANNLLKRNEKLISHDKKIQNDLDSLTKKYQLTLVELEQLREHNTNLISEVDASEESKKYIEKLRNDIEELTEEKNSSQDKFLTIVGNVKDLEKELVEVRLSHSQIEKEKDYLNVIIQEFEKNESLKAETIANGTQTLENYENLQEQLETLTEENNILKSKCEHIKQEKETLYEKIISLEHKCLENEKRMEEQQNVAEQYKSVLFTLTELQNSFESLAKEVDFYKNSNAGLKEKLIEYEKNFDDGTDLLEKYQIIKNEFDATKEDNRRLQSDVEGLQSYLTKISKENSILNDKLREVIASSENMESNDLLEDVKKLKSEVQTEKNKVEKLLRENNLLTEENLELKDQMQSRNYVKTAIAPTKNDSKGTIDKNLRENYEKVVKENNELAKKLADLENFNTTTHVNVSQLQESNQKLRLTNEKLERRLDEALVSLRHLHSLQENTELEYLRNILYEYLTGSGTHSVTLAKVLAAVVKFDDKQTNIILQKEKERQGLLRQLGLL